jgi:hypothetical protein
MKLRIVCFAAFLGWLAASFVPLLTLDGPKFRPGPVHWLSILTGVFTAFLLPTRPGLGWLLARLVIGPAVSCFGALTLGWLVCLALLLAGRDHLAWAGAMYWTTLFIAPVLGCLISLLYSCLLAFRSPPPPQRLDLARACFFFGAQSPLCRPNTWRFTSFRIAPLATNAYYCCLVRKVSPARVTPCAFSLDFVS